ncbi:MAG TPA: nucleotidyltransferase domain-containing protein [Candidatus Nanoarchaeia archaeon]|nr:nucleotidyltransferase domain-containing protein [Candidatus Nanoarchaeia archaeon]
MARAQETISPAIKKKVAALCRIVEKDNRVRMLFAVENGSRAWRLSSSNSDYDVRFVFARPIEDYISINPLPDVISVAFDKGGNKVSIERSLIDFSGFDVIKFVRMLSASNPTTIEWLQSDVVYYGEQNRVFREFALKHFNKTSLYFHYKSMCRQNYLKYLKSGNNVTYKKYLYAMRGLINAKWVVIKRTVPPIDFGEALQQLKSHIPKQVVAKLQEIIRLKSSGLEKDIVQNIVEIDEYIENFLKDDSEAPKEKAYTTLRELDAELKKIVLSQK